MAAITVPGVNTPTYQSWASAVAGRLNGEGVILSATLGADYQFNMGVQTGIPMTASINVGNAWNGTQWTAPRAGIIRASGTGLFFFGSSPGISNATGDQANLSLYRGGTMWRLAGVTKAVGQATISGSAIVSVTAGQVFSLAAYATGAGVYPTMGAGDNATRLTIEWVLDGV